MPVNHDLYRELQQMQHLPRGVVTDSGNSIWAPLIQLYKKLIHWLLYPGFGFLFERQSAFNASILQVLADLGNAIERTEKSLDIATSRVEDLEIKLQQCSNATLSVEKNFLEQNHSRYIEIRSLEREFLEQNQARCADFSQLNQECLSEIQATKQELIDIKFSQAHLRTSLDSLAEKYQRVVSSKESLTHH